MHHLCRLERQGLNSNGWIVKVRSDRGLSRDDLVSLCHSFTNLSVACLVRDKLSLWQTVALFLPISVGSSLKSQPSPPPNPQWTRLCVRGRRRLTFQTMSVVGVLGADCHLSSEPRGLRLLPLGRPRDSDATPGTAHALD